VTGREDRAAEADRRRREAIRRTVDAAPPLTHEQRDKLAVLLRPAGRMTRA